MASRTDGLAPVEFAVRARDRGSVLSRVATIAAVVILTGAVAIARGHDDTLYLGGVPRLSAGTPWPTCTRRGSDLTFYLHLAMPDGFAWASDFSARGTALAADPFSVTGHGHAEHQAPHDGAVLSRSGAGLCSWE